MILSLDDLRSLPAIAQNCFASSHARGNVTLTATRSIRTVQLANGTAQSIHICPELGEKPPYPAKTPELDREPEEDPFDGDWGKGQLIAKIRCDDDDNGSAEGAAWYSAVNNLNALAPGHWMLVPQEFRAQASDLLPADLELAYRVLCIYREAEREQILFFNGGPLAGASQPHLHLQFFPMQQKLPQKEIDDPVKEELPHVTFQAAIPPKATRSQLFSIYSSLLTSFQDLLSSQPPPTLPPPGPKQDSYNLLLTTSYMTLIPRRKNDIEVHCLGRNGEEETEKKVYVLNGLSFAGHWFVENEERAEELVAFGLEKALSEDGYPNTCSR